MQRILVIGCGGAGKSTLSRQLGARLGLPVLHLDAFYWRPGWVESGSEDWARQVAELISREAWVMDGNFASSLPERLAACDSVVFLDMPRWRCLWRVFWRVLRHHGEVRPDMAEGCPEQLDWTFVRWVWNFPRDVRPRLLELLAQAEAGGTPVFRLRTPLQVRRFLQSLPDQRGSE